MRRIVSATIVVGLGTALAAVVTASPVTASAPGHDLVGRSFDGPEPGRVQARAGAAEQLVSATATFSPANRATGITAPSDPRHQFAMPNGSLSVTVDYGHHWETGVLTYHYSLDGQMGSGDPTSQTRVLLGFGARDAAGSCTIEEAASDLLYRSIPDFLLYDSKETPDLASASGWTCAVLLVDSGQGTAPHDAFVAELVRTTATPRLSVTAPKKERLVKGVWTRVPVTVANASPEGIDARDVAVSGKGKGVKVRRESFGALVGQDDVDGHVWAKLVKPKATLKLSVSENRESLDRTSVRIRQRPAPPAPKAGSWTGGGADFAVRGGKVRGFQIFTQTTCGGYPDLPTTTSNTYSFVTTTIPRNNEVVGTERGNQGGDAAYSAYLEIEFVSRTKAVGTFSYFGPARCTAHTGFTARLKR